MKYQWNIRGIIKKEIVLIEAMTEVRIEIEAVTETKYKGCGYVDME